MKSILLTIKTFFLFMFVGLVYGEAGEIQVLDKPRGLKEVTERLAAKGKIISQIYNECGDNYDFSKVKCLEGDTEAKLAALHVIDEEVTELREQRLTLLEAEKTLKAGRALNAEMNEPAEGMKHPAAGAKGLIVAQKSIGELFLESKAFKEKGRESLLDIEMKTTMTAAAGWDPEALRVPRVAMFPTRPIAVVDFIPSLTTTRDTIKYMKETTFTRNAAEAAENAAVAESAIALTETSDEVEKLGTFLPVTDEQLEDVSSLRGYLNGRLTYMVQYRLDAQVIEGDGSTPNLLGTLNVGSINSQALGSDSKPDAIYKAFTLIRTVGFAEPSVLFINPNDWQSIRLLTTADGIYLFGSPMDAGPDRIWGVPVLQTMAVTENTALCGDYARHSNLYWRRGITLQVTDSHASLFTSSVQVIKATIRVAMVHYTVKAFAKITGI